MRQFFHINYRPRATRLFPIFNRLNSTNSVTLKAAYAKWEATELPELVLAVATKLVVLQTIEGQRRLSRVGKQKSARTSRILLLTRLATCEPEGP